ncbi:hypothetical protein MSAN_01804500 [Mycena sanguinolenta]|uniref:DUF6535 domain-containing protein n=1 Tax=Mycena sanguinolenta TaxID=230812 RepID=A0A8H6XUH1_9AGAR|nr:hypothetical protein MSAN_01804500 [Mycena sanguinolenta]
MSTASESVSTLQVSDNDRLIATLQMCFADLMQKQEEQGDRLHRALEALKPPAQATDKKTAFWNSYLKLADEHDQEFQQKYSTDLDITLIFAGLFSAVGSAFIIQIQPQLMSPNPPKIIVVAQSMLYISLFTTLLAALLAVLGKQWIMYYQAAGSRGTIEERGLERQRKLDGLVKWKFDTLVQMFPLLLQLALLLFSTSLSIYLWTINHCLAIIVMIMTSLGITSYVFLLLSAIIFPDCPYQTPLGPFLIHILSPCVSILQPIFSALWRVIWTLPSSLFRSRAVGVHLLPESGSDVFPSACYQPHPSLRQSDPYSGKEFTPASPEVPAVLWVLGASTDPTLISTAAEMAVDLQWPLDPNLRDTETVMTRLAEIVHLCFDFPTTKVRDNMARLAITCGRLYCSLRLLLRAANVHVESPVQHRLLLDIYMQTEFDTNDAELENVLHILKEWPHWIKEPDKSSPSTKWALHIIPSLKSISLQDKVEHLLDHIEDDVPSLDLPSFANYLCCLNSLFAPTDPRLLVQMDKTDFRGILMTQLFDALLDSLLVVDTSVIARIIDTTAQLTKNLVGPTRSSFHDDCSLVREILRFCNTFPRVQGWLDVVVSAAKVFRVDDATDLQEIHALAEPSILTPSTKEEAANVRWIYTALEHVHKSWQDRNGRTQNYRNWDTETARDIGALLKILACSGILPESPPVDSLRIILRALSASTDLAFSAFLVLKQGQTWLLDPNLQPTMHNSFMLDHLGRVVLDCKRSFPSSDFLPVVRPYIKMMKHLSLRPEWRPLLPITGLPTWMTIFSDDVFLGRMKALTALIRNVWVSKLDQDLQFTYESEECLAFALTALSDAWYTYDFGTTHTPKKFFQLIHSTISTALYSENRWNAQEVTYYSTQGLPPTLMAIFCSRLCNSLSQAAVNAHRAIPNNNAGFYDEETFPKEHVFGRMAKLLQALAGRLRTEFSSGAAKVQVKGRDRDVWWSLRRNLETMVDTFEKDLGSEPLVEQL